MLYIEDKESNINVIFSLIDENFSRKEEVPNFKEQILGMEKFRGVLELVKSDVFYPTLTEKATHLLIQVNKGHFFSNGNKRLSLVTAIIFIVINDHWFAGKYEKYKEKITLLFPSYCNFEEDANFKPYEFAIYNLSIIIADSNKYEPNFDMLKDKINNFFKTFLIKME